MGQYHQGASMQRGMGLGSFFGSLARKIMPVFGRAASTAWKGIKHVASTDAAKDLGKRLLDDGIDGVGDIIGGRAADETIAEKLENARREISATIKQSAARKGDRKRRSERKSWSSSPLLGGTAAKQRKYPPKVRNNKSGRSKTGKNKYSGDDENELIAS
jgi:hypothetical protein